MTRNYTVNDIELIDIDINRIKALSHYYKKKDFISTMDKVRYEILDKELKKLRGIRKELIQKIKVIDFLKKYPEYSDRFNLNI